MKRAVSLLLCLLVLGSSLLFAEGQGEYPERDITDIIFSSAGGGTDVCNRVVMAEMAKILGVNINVTNMPGGVAGSLAINEVYNRASDGYTLLGVSESGVTAAVQGGWDKKMDVWDLFIIGGSPDVVSVTPNTPYKTLADLVEAAKTNPMTIRAGASAAGSIHHLNLLALENGTGAKFNFIPYDGSAPSQNAAMTGEISLVVTSVAEQAQLIRGGKLRPLAVLVPDAFMFGDAKLPSAFTDYPSLDKYLPISQAIGFAIKADADESVKKVLTNAFDQAMKSDAVLKFANDSYYILSGATGKKSAAIFDALERNFAWTLWELGAAKRNPAELGIAKP
jgi:tripartite-type tricarboxylate transporter receptor subunit TctC